MLQIPADYVCSACERAQREEVIVIRLEEQVSPRNLRPQRGLFNREKSAVVESNVQKHLQERKTLTGDRHILKMDRTQGLLLSSGTPQQKQTPYA
jgi:hypothetical protein